MPKEGMAWRHIVINTLNSWHHGDARGFRSRGHRIHSTGDYKNPPPAGEHEGLLQYQKNISGEPIDIAAELRAIVGHTFVAMLLALKFRLLAISVADQHVHLVIELPVDLPEVKRIIGDAKRKSSRSVKDWLPGRIWAAGGTFKFVNDPSHLKNAIGYVLFDQGDDAWTWSHKDATADGVFGRKRSGAARVRSAPACSDPSSAALNTPGQSVLAPSRIP